MGNNKKSDKQGAPEVANGLDSDFIRHRALDENGFPVMAVYAHPSTPGAVIIEMLQEAIESIKHEIRQPAKVLSLEEFRKKGARYGDN